ncbi:MAG: hypothetical protein LBD24_07570 [Spirochaetaceae bacterium]|nr:hypothetical protein [Spirochaetaceae bacterium]
MKPRNVPPVGAEAPMVIAEALSRSTARSANMPAPPEIRRRAPSDLPVAPLENLHAFTEYLSDFAKRLKDASQTMRDLASGLETLSGVSESLSKNMCAAPENRSAAAAGMEALSIVTDALAQVPEKSVASLRESIEILKTLARHLSRPPAAGGT